MGSLSVSFLHLGGERCSAPIAVNLADPAKLITDDSGSDAEYIDSESQ